MEDPFKRSKESGWDRVYMQIVKVCIFSTRRQNMRERICPKIIKRGQAWLQKHLQAELPSYDATCAIQVRINVLNWSSLFYPNYSYSYKLRTIVCWQSGAYTTCFVMYAIQSHGNHDIINNLPGRYDNCQSHVLYILQDLNWYERWSSLNWF